MENPFLLLGQFDKLLPLKDEGLHLLQVLVPLLGQVGRLLVAHARLPRGEEGVQVNLNKIKSEREESLKKAFRK